MTTFNTVIVGLPYYDFNKAKLERNCQVVLDQIISKPDACIIVIPTRGVTLLKDSNI